MHEKKSSRRKLIVLVMLLALIVGIAAGGTLAWLMTETAPLENTFTEGNIDIYIREHELNLQTGAHAASGEYVAEQTGDIELLPGRTVYKDPTVFVVAGSEPCYVRMFMIVDYDDGMDYAYDGVDVISEWFDYGTGWTIAGVWQDKNAGEHGHVFEFRYSSKMDASAATEDVSITPLFHSITIPGDLDKNDEGEDMFGCLSEAKLIFIAQAVQVREGYTSAPFEGIDVPDVTLSMTDGSKTLKELMDRNIGP